MLVFTLFALCFVILRGIFMRFLELTIDKMPQCQFPVFCYFYVLEKLHRKYSWNLMKQVPEVLFFLEASRDLKRQRRGATGQPHTRPAQPRPWLHCLGVRRLGATPDDAPSPIKSLGTENPRGVSKISRIVPQCYRHRSQISGDRSVCSGTLPGWEVPPEPSPSVSIAVSAISIDLTTISINLAVSYDEEGVVHPRG
jgi:hypothetical protein